MAYRMKFRCPEASCRHLFTLVLEIGDDLPEHCPKCGIFTGEDPAAEPNLISIGGSNEAKTVDNLYREVEATSQYRAEAAGDPSLKITNMRDHIKVGEAAAMPVQNMITKTAEQLSTVNGVAANPYFSGAVQTSVAAAARGPGAAKGKNMGLTAIQERALPNVSPMTSPVALKAGFGGGFGR